MCVVFWKTGTSVHAQQRPTTSDESQTAAATHRNGIQGEGRTREVRAKEIEINTCLGKITLRDCFVSECELPLSEMFFLEIIAGALSSFFGMDMKTTLLDLFSEGKRDKCGRAMPFTHLLFPLVNFFPPSFAA